jgi:hypothetical protein
MGARLQILAADVAKDITRYAVSPPQVASDATRVCGISQCVTAARWARCDAVVVLDEAEGATFEREGVRGERIVRLEDFAGSRIDVQRDAWRSTQRLDALPEAEALELVGRIVRYSKKVVVADKMIGVSTRDDKIGPIKRHLEGVALLARAWKAWSPYSADSRLGVEVMTAVGQMGSRGNIDPVVATKLITTAMQSIEADGVLEPVSLSLKKEGEPQIFNDRLLSCAGRVWGVHHGFEDLGRLLRRGPRRQTMIDPPSDARETVFRDILALRNA